MSQPKGSVGVAVTISVLIIIAVTSVGYYQFVYCASSSCVTSAETSSASGGQTCSPPSCVTIVINPGAAALTTTAYTPDEARLVIGVNNTFQVLNNDSQSGGVVHSLTADSCAKSGQPCPFDTGIISYNETKGPFTITTPGTYPYYCIVHPTTMIGTIVVVAGPAGGGGAPSSTTTATSSSASASTSSHSTTGTAKGVSVSIPNGANSPSNPPGYVPDTITVVIGVNETVTWTNNDVAAHTVTSSTIPSGATSFNSQIMAAGSTFSVTFTVPGTYQYVCSLHSWMKGTVIVKSG
jgi:plastocyanin